MASFLALSALLLIAFDLPPLRTVAGGAVAWIGSAILSWCWGTPVGWSLTDANHISFAIPAYGALESGAVEIDPLLFIRNMPMFIAIVFAVAQTRLRYILFVLFGGLLSLMLLDGIVIAQAAWRAAAGESRPTELAFQLLYVMSIYYGTGGLFIAPIFVGAVVAMSLPGSPTTSPLRGMHKNARCPCGSGLKIKRCCGQVGRKAEMTAGATNRPG